MRAGAMRTRVRILRPTQTENVFGERTVVWVESAPVWAERAKYRGFRTVEGQELFPDYSAEFNIRDYHEMDENWRIREIGGHTYDVTNVIPNKDRGMLTLICNRVNE